MIQSLENGKNWNGESAQSFLCSKDGSETRNTHRRILRACQALGSWVRSYAVPITALLLLVVLALAAAVVVLAVRRCRDIPATLGRPAFLACPEDWVGYRRVCYYFSRDEGTWEQAQHRCSQLGASLAELRDEEMDFLFRLSGNIDYWLGLRRRGQWLQWKGGSSYNSSVEVLGNSECVYLADRELRSESCSKRQPYLCSKAQPHL